MLPTQTLEEAEWWERHVVEVLTGLPPDAPPDAWPQPPFDPETRTLRQRERTKAADTRRRPSPAEQRAAREARRLQAAELFAQGRTQAEVARELGVSRQSAHVWHTRFAQGGVETLRSRGPTGPDPKLSDAQLAHIEQALLKGAKANGFDTDLWTLERVGVVITQLTGVRHHPGHVWWILRQRLGWTLQRPERRASERDEEAIARWVAQEWPRIKRGPVKNRPGLSSLTNRPSR